MQFNDHLRTATLVYTEAMVRARVRVRVITIRFRVRIRVRVGE